jgi:hypothetical protein
MNRPTSFLFVGLAACQGAAPAADTGACEVSAFYQDADGDGWGAGWLDPIEACTAPEGYTESRGDCEDGDPTVHPGATEVWYDGVDQDCDGWPDFDADGDGFDGPSEGGDDCDDGDAAVNPAARDDDDDGVDDDCDGTADNDLGLRDRAAAVVAAGDEGPFSVVEGAANLTGDGRPDLLLGAPENDGKGLLVGCAYLLPGPIVGDEALAEAVATFTGIVEYDLFGSSLDAIGDRDGDGISELAIGAPGADDGAEHGGAVAIFYGPHTGALGSWDADVTLLGTTGGASLGTAVAGGGDADGDGLPDLAVGGPGDGFSGLPGHVGLFFDLTRGHHDLDEAGLRIEGDADDELGAALTDLQDLDGDGLADLVVGAPWAPTGAVYVFTGLRGGGAVLGTDGATAVLTRESSDDWAGAALDLPGDLDGDGYLDLAVGAPGARSGAAGIMGALHHGRVYAVRGPFSGSRRLRDADAVIEGDANVDVFWEGPGLGAGYAVSGGDLDGDGVLDLVLGAPAQCDSAGAVYALFGPTEGRVDLAAGALRILGTGEDRLGWSVDAGWDLRGDGVPDLVAVGLRADRAVLFDFGP